MASKIEYKSTVAGDLSRLDKATAARVVEKLERVLSQSPDAGSPLSGEFRGMRRYRIGDYRVIYTRSSSGVLVLRIAHRREAYR